MGDSYESEDGDDHLGGGAKGQIELAFFPLALHFSKAFPIQEADHAGSISIPHSPLPDAWRGLLVSLVQCRADVRYVGAGESAKAVCDLTLTVE